MPAIDSFFIQLGFDDAGAERALSRIELLLTNLNTAVNTTNTLLHNMSVNFREVNSEINNVDNSVHTVNNSFNTFNNTVTRTTSNSISLFRSLRNEALLFGGILSSIGGLGVLLGNTYGKQAELGRAAENMGLDPILVKSWQNAGEQVGISPESTLRALNEAEATASLMKNHQYDLTQEARAYASGDRNSFLARGGQISDLYSGQGLLSKKNELISQEFLKDPKFAQVMANSMGVGDIFNLMKLPTAEFNSRIEEAKRQELLNRDNLDAAQKASEAWIKLTNQVENITNKLINNFAPTFESLLSKIDSLIERLFPKADKAEQDLFNMGLDGIAKKIEKYFFDEADPFAIKNIVNNGSEPDMLSSIGGSIKSWIKGTSQIDSSKTQATKRELLMELTGYPGVDEQHAQSLIATMWRESQFNAGIDSGTGKYKGLIQWSPKRRQDYADWIEETTGVKGKKLEEQNRHEQIRFLMHEATTKKLEKANWDAFMAEKDPRDMQWTLIDRFIRPLDKKGDLQKDLEYKRLLFNLDKKQSSKSSSSAQSKTEVSMGDVIFNGVKDATGMQGVLDKYFSKDNFFPQFNSGQR